MSRRARHARSDAPAAPIPAELLAIVEALAEAQARRDYEARHAPPQDRQPAS